MSNENVAKQKLGIKVKVTIIIVGLLVSIGVGTGIAFKQYYTEHYDFYKGKILGQVKINGVDCSNITPEQAAMRLSDECGKYSIKVIKKGETVKEITGGDLDYYVWDTSKLEGLADNDPKKWKQAIKEEHDYSITDIYSYEEDNINSLIRDIKNKKEYKKAKDSIIKYSNADNKYIVTEDKAGEKIDYRQAIVKVKNAIRNKQDKVNIDDCVKGAHIKKNNKRLNKQANKLNSYLVTVTVKIGNDNVAITPDIVHSWMEVDSNYNVGFNSEKMREWIQDNLSSKYDTYGKERDFKTHSGKTIKITQGAYGWLIRMDYTADRIKEVILSGKDGVCEPYYSYSAFKHGKDDVGNTYIELSISEQKVWVWKDGKVVDSSSCVTGNSSLGHDTHKGIYSIAYKAKDRILRGSARTYESYVRYWMPFYDGQGLHDADWRSSFGGSIYKTNGSHGCVNLPVDKARSFYNLIEDGEPIIIY